MIDSVLVIGPYIVRVCDSFTVDEHVKHTGFAIEYATDEDVFRLSIFICVAYAEQKLDFTSYTILEADLPFEIVSYGFQVKDYTGGTYITVSSFLAGLYEQFTQISSVQSFLADFYEHLPFVNFYDWEAETSKYPMIDVITLNGYRVGRVMPYGRRLFVDIVWLFPQVRNVSSSKSYLNVGGITFHPKPDRSLGHGKWSEFRKSFIETLLFRDFRKLAPRRPVKLFNADAIEQLLGEFEWTSLALMSNQQARLARIEFVSTHQELLSNPRLLASALKEAGLYSSGTSLHQICKFLPGLIAESKR